MKTVKIKIYIENFNEGMIDMICDDFTGADFIYGTNYVKFKGSEIDAENFKKLIKEFAKITNIKTI
ncbi:MAG: hypothetical protein J6S67_21620 [Methanobrevibacter sp.]|nr:hypothetical protein [Methanobrevibacter sp.]